MMKSGTSPSIGSVLPISFLLIVLGFGGLFWLVMFTQPTVGPRWLFFFCLFLAATGTTLPFAAFLNRRFGSDPPATPAVILRQSLWVGIFVSTLAWLQLGRVLNLAIALLLAAGFFIIEGLLRLRERSQWRP